MKTTVATLGFVAVLLFAGAVIISFLPVTTPNWIEQLQALMLFAVVLFAARYGCREYKRTDAGSAYGFALVGMCCGIVCSGLGAFGTLMYFEYGLPRPAWFAGGWIFEILGFEFDYAPLIGAATGIAIAILAVWLRRTRSLSI